MPFLPPFEPFVGQDGTASVYALRGTRWQLAPLRWMFPALRCSDDAGVGLAKSFTVIEQVYVYIYRV